MSVKSTLRKVGIAAIATGVAFGVAVPTAANADPASSGRTYQIAGSDTIQDVFNAVAGSTSNLGSWDAFATSTTITPKAGGATFGRPHGSGDGVKALSAAWRSGNAVFAQTVGTTTTNYTLQQGGTHELDFARSSSRPSSSLSVTPGVDPASDINLTYVPFARDAVGVGYQSHVTTAGTNDASVTSLSVAALKFVYNSTSTGTFTGTGYTIAAGSGTTDPVYTDTATSKTRILQPVLPQSASGTRSFFLSAIGVSSIGSWVEQANENENDAQVLNLDGEIIPFSAAQWISQKNGVVTSTFTGANAADVKLLNDASGNNPVTGTTTLAPNTAYFGSSSSVPSGSTPFARDTYVVVPTANYAAQETQVKNYGHLVNPVSLQAFVKDYGFLELGYTGSTQGQAWSKWAN